MALTSEGTKLIVPAMRFPGRNRVIMDSMHGLVDFDQRLRRVVDARELQRLRWIRQTGLAFLTYPNAEHSRFSHAIGAYAVARRVFAHLRALTSRSALLSPTELDDDLESAFIVAALCHDLGHTAFSHVLEQTLLPDALRTHEACTLKLLEADTEIANLIKGAKVDIEQVTQLLKGTHWNDGLCKLLSGHIDVDRWDYLLRDAAAAGVVYGKYDLNWLIHSIALVHDAGRRPRLVIEARRGIVALRHFLSARKSMYQQVYWHATIRGADRLLRAIFERVIDPDLPKRLRTDASLVPAPLRCIVEKRKPQLDEFLRTDDTTVIAAVKAWREQERDPVLKYLCKSLLERRLFKAIDVPSNKKESVDKLVPRARTAVKRAMSRQTTSPISGLGSEDTDNALSYLVLRDTCEFKFDYGLEGVYFDIGEQNAKSAASLPEDMQPGAGISPFQLNRLYVPAEARDAVSRALGVTR